MKTLFEPVIDKEKLSTIFTTVCKSVGAIAARKMLDEIYQDFHDRDGNFLEQFQSNSFSARIFELYLFAYFSRSGYKVEFPKPAPDFIITKNGTKVAVEATTINESTSGVFNEADKDFDELSDQEKIEYLGNDLPIRFGSPLISKLQKKYWNYDWCKGIPIVIAIEAFFDSNSLGFTDNSLTQYVYGSTQFGTLTTSGKLIIKTKVVDIHKKGKKKIPSGFFSLPNSEYISAIIFTNSGTFSKFTRMGYQSGYGNDKIRIKRFGTSYNEESNALDPIFFHYDMDSPPFVEPWGQGLVVLHNPNCLYPIKKDFFDAAVYTIKENEEVKVFHGSWHPFNSRTVTIDCEELKKTGLPNEIMNSGSIAIGAIGKEEFESLRGFKLLESNPMLEENGWYIDETNSFLGLIAREKVDNDWGYVVYARDKMFEYRAIEFETNIASRNQALLQLVSKMSDLLAKPQRIFFQEE